MDFNKDTYPQIKKACEQKEPIEFEVDRDATAFSDSDAPAEWTQYPPALLPPQGYAQVFRHAGTDARGALTRLELVVHLDGGKILYKQSGNDQIAMRITWPSRS
jgi:hypothetical protein